jgi:hypothetical protein
MAETLKDKRQKRKGKDEIWKGSNVFKITISGVSVVVHFFL